MLAGTIPIISDLFQYLLDGLGWVLARIYDVIPNYGVSIIVLTILIRFLLFPLGMKQIKSMQHMQAIQPKIKEIQKKYKNNKQKVQEETMRLYKEAGVNPLGGCLPVIAQFPILIAMYAILRAPGLLGLDPAGEPVEEGQQAATYEVTNNHLPVDSQLFADTIQHERTSLVVVNLQCSASQAGAAAPIKDTQGTQVKAGEPLVSSDNEPIVGVDGQTFTSKAALDCGDSPMDKAGYIALLLIMVGTAVFQTRQMQKASPAGAASGQQQAIMKVMPVFFGFIGFTFPAGLVVYWTTSNFFQIGQQTLLLRAGHIGPDALDKRMAEQREKQAQKGSEPQKKGFMSSMLDRAEQERTRRDAAGPSKSGGSSKGSKGKSGGSGSKGSGTSGKGGGTPRPKPGGSKGSSGNPPRRPKKPGSGGSDDT